MDTKRKRGATRGNDAPAESLGDLSDSSRGNDDLNNTKRKPANIRETAAWKSSQQGLGRMLNNYKATLAESFKGMNRYQQEALVEQFCVIVTIGVSVLVLLLFYGLIPSMVRVLAVPAVGVGAFMAGKKIVTPVVLDRLSAFLNVNEDEEEEQQQQR